MPAELPRVLAWTEANAGAVEEILAARTGLAGIVDVLTLSGLANEDESSMTRLLRIVGAPRARRSTKGVKVLKFATWIGGQAPPVRRRALRLLGLVLYPRLLRTRGDDLDVALGHFKASAAAENAGFYRNLLRLLERLPRANHARFRFWFLALWCHWRAQDSGLVVRLLREVHGYLSGRPDSTVIDSWLNEAPEDSRWLLVLLRWTDGRLRGHWQTVFHAISQTDALPCERPVTCADGPLIVNLVVATGDAGDACRCFRQLDEAGLRHECIDIEVLQLAFELDTEARLFAALVSHLRDELHDRLSLIRVIDRPLAHAGWAGVTAALIAEGQLALVYRCARRWAVADALQAPVEPHPRQLPAMPVMQGGPS